MKSCARWQILMAALLGLALSTVFLAEALASKAVPAAARKITVQEYAAYPALFVTSAKTLDPVDIARQGLFPSCRKQI